MTTPRRFEGFSNKQSSSQIFELTDTVILELLQEQMDYANRKADEAAHDPNVEQEYWRGWHNAINNLRLKIIT